MTEEWRAVIGFEGRYEVSNYGRVRSVSRVVPYTRHHPNGVRTIKSRILIAGLRSGYPTIALINTAGEKVGKLVHRMVAEAFVANPEGHRQVNHLDANKQNNRPENLEWCNQSRNVAHTYEIGIRPTGAAHHFAQLRRDAQGRCVSEGE